MVRFSNDCCVADKPKISEKEYVFTIYEVNEKVSKAGNDYWQVKIECEDGRICDNLMFSGKVACKTLALFTAIGLADGKNFPTTDFTPNDILGKRFKMTPIKDKESDFYKLAWNLDSYKKISKQTTVNSKAIQDEEDIPF